MADKPEKRTGRRTILDATLIADLSKVLSAGATISDACDYVGCGVATYHSWINRGEREQARREGGLPPNPKENVFCDFLDAMTKARSQARVRAVTAIQSAMTDSWQAAAWYLERTRPSEWGRRMAVETSGPGGKPIQFEQVTPDALEAKLEGYLASLTEGAAAAEPTETDPESPETPSAP